MRNRVFDRYRRGEISSEDIEQELESAMTRWSESEDTDKPSLLTYLGMTRKEYEIWSSTDEVPSPNMENSEKTTR